MSSLTPEFDRLDQAESARLRRSTDRVAPLSSSPRARQDPAPPFGLLVAIGVFVAACIVLALPWLSGAVTVPWDAKAQFRPQLQFLAKSLADGESPFWTP